MGRVTICPNVQEGEQDAHKGRFGRAKVRTIEIPPRRRRRHVHGKIAVRQAADSDAALSRVSAEDELVRRDLMRDLWVQRRPALIAAAFLLANAV
jgi:1,2-phenylacetyl-CoA epoxidase PaaB subunit